ncbi:MAG: S8 family serine peptidase [Natronosporangium sp.]
MQSLPRPSRVLSALLALTLPLGFAATFAGRAAAAAANQPGPEQVTVLVRLAGTTTLDATQHASGTTQPRSAAEAALPQIAQQHADFLRTARAQAVELTQQAEYANVVNALAVTVHPSDVPALRRLPGVAGVYPNEHYQATLADAVPHVGAPEVWQRRDPLGVPVTGARQTVAVLDTGIDYHHPDLGGCFGPGCRVVDGYDFANGDADPADDNFHGTHVAGIIGASGGVTGVAPDVEFLAYKVLDQFGQGTLANILAGLDAAVDPFNFHDPSVINMSLGNSEGDGTDLLSLAVQQATEAGFTVVTSAGNTGPDAQTIGAPASAPGALTVGASTTGVLVPEATLVQPRRYDLKSTRLGFSANPGPGTIQLDVVDVGAGEPSDYEGVDVTGKVVLVDSGDFPFRWFQDGMTAEQHGAAAALIVRPDPAPPLGLGTTRTPPSIGDDWRVGTLDSGDDGRLDSLIALQIPAASATDLRGFLADGPAALEVTAVDATDTVPAFSSRGPSGLMQSKPDLVAPGVEIRSTVPVGMFGGDYGRVSGTSMAAPMVSGAAILLNQLHPDWSADQVEAALTGSARRLPDESPLVQGAGLLDIPAAAEVMVTASPRTASLGLADMDPSRATASTTVTLVNHDTQAHELTLRVRETSASAAAVTVSPDSVRLVGGERRKVTVTVDVERLDGDLDVSGSVIAEVDGDHRDLTIPYLLSVRPLSVFATPDPAVDGSEVFIRTPVPTATAPVVTVNGPRKFRWTGTARHDHGTWWRVPVETGRPGLYRVSAAATTTLAYGSVELRGEAAFEVVTSSRAARWKPVGPYGSGGEMAASPMGGDDMLVTSDRTASMFRTFNGGESWEQLSNLPIAGGSGFGAQPVLAADPTSRDRYYLGIDAGFVDPTYQGALMVTDNGGDSWQRLPYPDDRVFEMAVGADGQTLAVVSDEAFYASIDGGQTWRTLWGPWAYAGGVAIDGDRIYLATATGLYAYDNIYGDMTGPTFLVNPDEFGGMDGIAAVGGHVFAWPFSSGEPIYESTDAGQTWSVAYTPEFEGFMVSRKLKVIDGDVWAISDEGVWVGEDMGAAWSAKPTPQDDVVVGDADAFDGAVWTSSDGGLFSTTDKGSTYTRTGIQGVDVHGVALADVDGRRRLVAATTWDTYTTDLGRRGLPASPDWGGSPVEGQFGVESTFVTAVPGQPNVLYKVAGINPFGIYRSDDGGASWKLKFKAEQLPTSFLVHPADPDSLYVGFQYYDQDRGLFISHDGGDTWRRERMDRAPLALAGDPTDPARVYLGDLQGFYVSDDSGRHFQRRQSVPTTAIGIDPERPQRLVLGGHRLWVSRDAGASLEPSRYLPLRLWVSDVEFGRGGQVYASTASFYDAGLLKGGRGVLVSGDDGRSFRSISDGLGTLDALSLAIADSGQVYVGLRGGGVYVTTSP